MKTLDFGHEEVKIKFFFPVPRKVNFFSCLEGRKCSQTAADLILPSFSQKKADIGTSEIFSVKKFRQVTGHEAREVREVMASRVTGHKP